MSMISQSMDGPVAATRRGLSEGPITKSRVEPPCWVASSSTQISAHLSGGIMCPHALARNDIQDACVADVKRGIALFRAHSTKSRCPWFRTCVSERSWVTSIRPDRMLGTCHWVLLDWRQSHWLCWPWVHTRRPKRRRLSAATHTGNGNVDTAKAILGIVTGRCDSWTTTRRPSSAHSRTSR
jgi:hypothetical protein